MTLGTVQQFSNSYHTLSIPELGTLILSFSDQQACASLAQTCRKIYEISIPFVWAHVDDARNLLRLIVYAYESPARPTIESPASIILPDISRHPNIFSRFSVYAPYVKSLDVYGRSGELYQVHGWKALISRAQRRPLLPNLQTISISTECGKHGSDQPMWVGAFASPSLTEFCVFLGCEGWDGSISYAATSFIMKYMVQHCPNLQKLGLFPNIEKGNHEENGESNYLALLSGAPFHEYIGGLTNLRSVHGSLAWFSDQVVLNLGRLPHLHTLETTYICDDTGGDALFQLPDGLFPSLRRLILCNTPAIDASNVMRYGPSLLRNLTYLEVGIDLHDLEEYDEDDLDDSEWLDERFFEPLADIPNLSELKLTALPRGEDCEIDEFAMEIFAALPLRSLSLRSVRLGEQASEMDLGRIWPSLVRLEIPSHPAPGHALPRFAAIPCLVHLELRLDFHVQPMTVEGGIQQTELISLLASDGSMMYTNPEHVESTARMLTDTWPNLSSVTWFDTKVDASSRVAPDLEHIQALNARIAALRAA